MFYVRCRTNLDDIMRFEEFPTELPALPNIGDKIESATTWKDGVKVQLKVCSITWKKHSEGLWYPEIELHIPSNFNSVARFEIWYSFIRGVISKEYYIKEANRLDEMYYKSRGIKS